MHEHGSGDVPATTMVLPAFRLAWPIALSAWYSTVFFVLINFRAYRMSSWPWSWHWHMPPSGAHPQFPGLMCICMDQMRNDKAVFQLHAGGLVNSASLPLHAGVSIGI